MVRVRGRVPLVVVLLIGVVGMVLVSACSALGARGHVFDKSFGEPCLVEPCAGGTLKEPDGVAVNEASGDVYVVDKGDNRVERFSAAGAYLGQFDGSGTFEVEGKTETGVAAGGGGLAGEVPTGKFSAPEAVAVDNSCGLHKPAPLTETSKPKTCIEVDPSDGDVYVLDTGHEVIDKFSATGAYIGQVTETPAGRFLAIFGIVVNPIGQLLVIEKSNPDACAFGEESICVSSFANQYKNMFETFQRVGGPGYFLEPGLAVSASGDLYVHLNQGFEGTDALAEFDSSGKEVFGEHNKNAFDVEPPSGFALNLNDGDVFVDNIGTVASFGSDGSLIERLVVPGGSGSGVGVSSITDRVYVADSQADVIDIYVPEPAGAPTVAPGSGFVSRVTSDSATLNAGVNPHGASTGYHFEYGRCASFSTCSTSGYESSAPTTVGSVGSDFEVHFVSTALGSLQLGAVYHFRVVAHNAFNGHGVTAGEELVFTTQTSGTSFTLPDGRKWELVSPPDKGAASLQALTAPGLIEASASGTAFSYLANAPTEAGALGNANGVQIFSVRGPRGWTSSDVSAPHADATGASTSASEYVFFSNSLSMGVVQPFGRFVPSLSGEASEQTAFVRSLYLDGKNVDSQCVTGCYRPLVTGEEGYENVPVGTEFGQEGSCPRIECGPQFRGSTPDMSHVILESNVGLTEGTSGGLYEWTAGHLAFVGAGSSETHFQAVFYSESDDGSRTVFSASVDGSKQLFMHDMVSGTTVQLDAHGEGCLSCENGGGIFQGTSADGSRVFFTDQKKLTSNAGAGGGAVDLYECEMIIVAGVLQCRLADLTPLDPSEGQAGVVGRILGMSQDGTWVYFAANGSLASGAERGACESGSPDASCGLYVLHSSGNRWGAPRLVGVLSQADFPDWAFDLEQHPARVSPNGQWLAFLSERSLSGYDNRDVASGKPDQEVYLFDGSRAVSRAATGVADNPVCVSCDPSSEHPSGRIASGGSELFNGKEVVPVGEGVAGIVPGWTAYSLGLSLYQSRFLSDSGRLFFNASDNLVSSDVNGNWDVYEFEPAGVGDCVAASSTFSTRSDGCVGLISAGTAPGESVFLDASASGGGDIEGREGGGDVFFLTQSKLVSADFDSGLDIYDAHECGVGDEACFGASVEGISPCVTGDSCKTPPSRQPDLYGLPASGTFAGKGNAGLSPVAKPKHGLTRAQKYSKALKVCRTKRNRRKRSACETQAQKKYGYVKKITRKRKMFQIGR